MRELTIEVGERRATTVSALLLRPRRARALFVFGHGAGAGMRHRFMTAVSESLAAAGVATLRYQFPYLEQGRRRPDPPGRLAATVRAAVLAGRRATRGLPLFAGGKSMGGRISSVAEASEPLGVEGLVFLGFPLHAAGGSNSDPSSRRRAEVLFGVDRPMLFVQGTRDALAELGAVRRLDRRLGDRSTLHVVDGANHSFEVLKRSGRTDSEVLDELTGAVTGWIDGVLARRRGATGR